jgi:hypothetical protein
LRIGSALLLGLLPISVGRKFSKLRESKTTQDTMEYADNALFRPGDGTRTFSSADCVYRLQSALEAWIDIKLLNSLADD